MKKFNKIQIQIKLKILKILFFLKKNQQNFMNFLIFSSKYSEPLKKDVLRSAALLQCGCGFGGFTAMTDDTAMYIAVFAVLPQRVKNGKNRNYPLRYRQLLWGNSGNN